MNCPFRWRISATLTTASPFHLGSGGIASRTGLNSGSAPGDRSVKIQAVSTTPDAGGEIPYIPGNSLKGVLRSWLDASVPDEDLKRKIADIFGTRPQDEDACGSRIVFCDALAVRPKPADMATFGKLPWWEEKRLAAVETNVAIDRRTGTASDQKLFHTEYVPSGIDFAVVVDGESEEATWEQDAQIVLLALQQFRGKTSDLSMGANTANGWGRFSPKGSVRIEAFDRAGMKAWLKRFFEQGQGHKPAMWHKSMTELEQKEIETLARTALTLAAGTPNWLEVNVTLQFSGPFLVNAPEKTHKIEGDEKPNHAPRLTADGRVLLPSSGMRGALRAQGERIIRTLKADAACRVSDESDACKPVHSVEDLGREKPPCLACLLFGASGWKSPIEISDFESDTAHASENQEFVAIDRFTGGNLPGAKFNAKYVHAPTLTGTIRIERSRTEDWGWGLLALLARDLVEGDIRFGFGKTKGYGECLAQITVKGTPFPGGIPDPQKEVVSKMVKCFRDMLAKIQKEAV